MSAEETMPAGSEQVTRLAADIRRVLEYLIADGIPIEANLGLPALQFHSNLIAIDEANDQIVIARSRMPDSDRALLARPRCTFIAMPARAHLEFVAAHPRQCLHEGTAAIALDFPEVLVYLRRRSSPRVELGPDRVLVHVTADASGVLPFDAWLADISDSGVALLYAREITLEPGTLLKGCSADLPRGDSVTFDVEVRYSQQIDLPDSTRVNRSGCRFVGVAPSRQIIERLMLAGRLQVRS